MEDAWGWICEAAGVLLAAAVTVAMGWLAWLMVHRRQSSSQGAEGCSKSSCAAINGTPAESSTRTVCQDGPGVEANGHK